ncbi:5-formyltetrahydrofolate cyclo-ligase [Paenibacillus xylanexedens]|uniref:5-formyltetrahydrofolate cyclo-ligase n=1 Tax=Paenibacillus xylanexedens TaxID=528191 RepID=UPI0016432BBA|nr:5-formyltetrahydrofolate cyclo-ligase [Paenibacillus xylanexedens]
MQDRMEHKSELRSRLKQSRDLLDESLRLHAMGDISLVVKRELQRLRLDKPKLTIFSYLSYRSEATTAFLFEDGWKHGDVMLAPKVLANPTRMELRRVAGEQDIESGVWGIPEPKDSCEVLQPEDWPYIDLVIVPGLGFDRQGGRIGYGGGYYDRFAETLAVQCSQAGQRPQMAALVLPGQLQDEIPMEPRDLRLDLLMTTEGVLHINKGL